MKHGIFVLTLAAAAMTSTAAIAAAGTQPGTNQVITRATFAGAWPFTVDQGTLACYRGQAITFTTGGKTYTVNGSAQTIGKSLGYGWQRINTIWRDSPEIPGSKIPLADLINAGNQLCKPWP